jgi:hypothetical protein
LAISSRKPVVRRGLIATSVLGVAGGMSAWVGSMLRMPGFSYRGPLAPLSEQQQRLAAELETDVRVLAAEIGERHYLRYAELQRAAAYIARRFREAGYQVERQRYEVGGQQFENLAVELAGSRVPGQLVVIGAHYDSVPGSPGANDNGSGVAALLAMASRLAAARPERTLRLVAFANEEMPHFRTPAMGSWVYAERCRGRAEHIVAMLCLETLGYYSEKPGTQRYPPPLSLLYPAEGNFLAFVANTSSRPLLRQVVAAFRTHAQFPSEGAALPAIIPGVGWSDQWAFWRQGYPGVMVTDTAPYRYPFYHTSQDQPDRIDYPRLARVVEGLAQVVQELGVAP